MLNPTKTGTFSHKRDGGRIGSGAMTHSMTRNRTRNRKKSARGMMTWVLVHYEWYD